jgi:23S rRNA (adenine2503-C2)-methyltransferase
MAFFCSQVGRADRWVAVQRFASSCASRAPTTYPWVAQRGPPQQTRNALIELSEDVLGGVLGGSGRARMVWDMLRNGDDPIEQAAKLAASRSAARESERMVRGMLQTERGSPAQGEGGDTRAPPSPCGLTPKTAQVLWESGLAMPHGEIKTQVVSACGTRKLLIALQDGRHVEAVLIPSEEHSKSKRRRTTLCVSSQVGCARGCIFCATGKLGLTRNLTAAEILLQLFLAAQVGRQAGLPAVTNVVFMGEGEPLNNLRQVAKAAQVMHDPRGFALSPRRVTVSTVAPSVSHVQRLATLECALAWSLHAADDSIRRRLVPTQTDHVEHLRDAFVKVLAQRGPGHHLFVEVTLLKGINDSNDDAFKLVRLLEPLRVSASYYY